MDYEEVGAGGGEDVFVRVEGEMEEDEAARK